MTDKLEINCDDENKDYIISILRTFIIDDIVSIISWCVPNMI